MNNESTQSNKITVRTNDIIWFSAVTLMIILLILSIVYVVRFKIEERNTISSSLKIVKSVSTELLENDNIDVQSIGLEIFKLKTTYDDTSSLDDKSQIILTRLIELRLELNKVIKSNESLNSLNSVKDELDRAIDMLND